MSVALANEASPSTLGDRDGNINTQRGGGSPAVGRKKKRLRPQDMRY